ARSDLVLVHVPLQLVWPHTQLPSVRTEALTSNTGHSLFAYIPAGAAIARVTGYVRAHAVAQSVVCGGVSGGGARRTRAIHASKPRGTGVAAGAAVRFVARRAGADAPAVRLSAHTIAIGPWAAVMAGIDTSGLAGALAHTGATKELWIAYI